MRAALGLAQRGLGQVWPNPAVGCVLVREGRVIGRGWTQPGGRPHAETEALSRAGEQARGATAYVTLEPCAHQGETPPCAAALADAGVGTAVIACRDPDPRVDGAGFAMLADAGMRVRQGVLEAEAKELNAGFFHRVRTGKPLVTLKLAASLDGRIATSSGESKWITGADARAHGHGLRARHDAIVVGSGTVLADDPELTCRLPGMIGRSPVRVILDGRLRTPVTAKLIASANQIATWVLTTDASSGSARQALEAEGAEVLVVDMDSAGHPDLGASLDLLGSRGITRALVEGGGTLAAGFLQSGLADRLVWARSGALLGGDGLAAIGDLGLSKLEGAPKFDRIDSVAAGDDLIETFALVRS